MGASVRWYGDEAEAKLRKALGDAIRRAGQLVQTRCRLACNRPAQRVRKKRKHGTSAGPAGSQYTQFIGSAPGSPPMVRTSFGRRSILVEYRDREIVSRIGPAQNAEYMALLELGTRTVAPRPWLVSTIERAMPAIRAMIGAVKRRLGP